MKSIEFNNFTEFYNFLVDNNIEDTPVTAEFKKLVEQINVGCGCGKKNRIKNVQTFYLSLSMNLDVTAEELIKSSGDYDEVKLLHEGNLFFVF
tara:strand:+ start:197 stop:475 length:279 start_codon:yes stop_codon:yes gene_type:complete